MPQAWIIPADRELSSVPPDRVSGKLIITLSLTMNVNDRTCVELTGTILWTHSLNKSSEPLIFLAPIFHVCTVYLHSFLNGQTLVQTGANITINIRQ